ncbi:hypothetical protein HPC49_25755 [Pyxidicoccus fallax]|uniref:Uncharacterized protein n=1 Tax=Pyxidicoccus fallax TaxID=394095 RepID=A0A848LS36_9BACT|nr:hypothetical protein [Pyxidicoccus fallax]NMO20768.1 hypothetical protein [Pyxidicoccus fallax]NPC81611.1 hypothetical protein [Pyxidicoccus fallax]
MHDSHRSAKRGAFSDAAYDGNIGSGLLKRFVATFDYPRQVLRRSLKLLPVGVAVRIDFTRAGAPKTTQLVPRNLIPD